MKKVLGVVLALALLLPGPALAETEIDVGIGVLTVGDGAIVQLIEKTEEGGTLAVIVPDRGMGRPFYDGISVVWSPEALLVAETSAEDFAQSALEASVAELAAIGVTALGSEVTLAELDAGSGRCSLRYTLETDCASFGVEQPLTLHYAALAVTVAGDGTYAFTCSAMSAEGLDMLLGYLDGIAPGDP